MALWADRRLALGDRTTLSAPGMSEPDFQPTLTGPTVIARSVTAGDWAELFAAGSDPEIWKVHPRSDR